MQTKGVWASHACTMAQTAHLRPAIMITIKGHVDVVLLIVTCLTGTSLVMLWRLVNHYLTAGVEAGAARLVEGVSD